MAFLNKIRLFTEQDIYQNINVNLLERNINYLKNVMRCKNGDIIRLFNGRDGEWLCELRELQSKAYVIPIKIHLSQDTQKINDIWLIFSLIKNSRSRLLIDKATQLGVSKIFAVKAARSNIKSINIQKAKLTAIESAEQCGRVTLPQIKYYESFDAFFQNWPRGRSFIWGDFNSNPTKVEKFINVGGLIIGPEGGFAQQEKSLFLSYSNSKPVSLGKLTLRSETAAIAMLTMWNAINKVWEF